MSNWEKERDEYVKNAKVNWEGFNVKGWGIHSCLLDAECRYHGAPKRVQFNTPFGTLHFALWKGSSIQWYQPFLGYTRKWSPIAWHPKNPRIRKKDIWREN